jgi:hypothetical protein
MSHFDLMLEGRDSALFRRSKRLCRENWRRYGKKRFLGHSIRCMSDVNVLRKRAGTILSDGINKYLLHFLCGFYGFSSGT